MNENKKLYVILGAIALIVIAVVALSLGASKKQQKIYEDFETVFNGSENRLVYIGRTGCSWCQLLNPSLQEMASRYNFEYTYINTDKFSKKYFNQVLAKLGLTSVGTPYLAIVGNGKVVANQNGYLDYDELFKLLQTNSIIDKEAKLLLDYIGLKEYKELLAGKEKSVIVVGQSTCSHCVNAKLVLNQVVEENNIQIHYLNTSYLTPEEGTEFQESLDYFSSSWGTPVMLVVQDGKLVDVLEGETTKENYVTFLKEQGVL